MGASGLAVLPSFQPWYFGGMKIQVIANGIRPRAVRCAQRLCQALSDLHDVRWVRTSRAGEAGMLIPDTADLVIAVGGDGTWHECINGWMMRHQQEPSRPLPVLALLPAGNGNDFARSQGWSGSIEALLARIARFEVKRIDVGRVQSGQATRWFINICDAGFGAAAARRVALAPRLLPAPLRFPWAILRTFMHYRPKEIIMRCNGEVSGGRRLMVAVANAPYFGRGICIAPQASPEDGLFDVTIVGGVSLAQYLRFLPALKQGRTIRHPMLHYLRTDSVALEGAAGFECDGEQGPPLPVSIGMVAQVLPVLT